MKLFLPVFKTLLILLYTLISIYSIAQKGGYSLLPAGGIEKTGISVKFVNENEIIITWKTPQLEIQSVPVKGKEFLRILLAGTGIYTSPGYPSLPFIRKFIDAGNFTDYSYTASHTDTVYYHIQPILPYIKPEKRDQENSGGLDFLMQDIIIPVPGDSFPRGFYAFNGIRSFSGRRVLDFYINPVIYYPSESCIRVLKELTIRLKFSGKLKGVEMKRFQNATNCGQYSNSFIYSNKKVTAAQYTSPQYLIVTNHLFSGSMQPFAEWKRRSGYQVSVLKESDFGSDFTAEGIRKVLKDSFVNGRLRYVLLVGDVGYMPLFTGMENSLNDHSYTVMNDSSILPDFVISRFSVNDPAECGIYVNKIINYERNPEVSIGQNWFGKAASIASSANLDDWHGRDVVRFFRSEGFSQVDDLRAFLNKFNSVDITNSVDSGRSWVFYIGHGNSVSWLVNGGFDNNAVRALTNSNMLPVVVSVSCSGASLGVPGTCFGERWMNTSDSTGAAGFIGATEDTYFYYSDTLAKYAMFSYVNGTASTLGDALNYGKIFMNNCFSPDSVDSLALETMQQFMLFGDPAMMPWTKIPARIISDYRKVIKPGIQGAAFRIYTSDSAITRAVVCLSNRDFSFYKVTTPDSLGNVLIDGKFPDTGMIFVVVTGRNLVPVYDSINLDTGIIIPVPKTPKISISPVPFRDYCTVSLVNSDNRFLHAELISPSGAIVRTINNLNTGRFNISRDKLTSGIYVLLLTDDKHNIYRLKLVAY